VLAVAGFARPAGGPLQGTDRVVVLVVEGMDAGAWQAARETYLVLAAELADRPGVVARVRESLSR
jgi:hypothetical protein